MNQQAQTEIVQGLCDGLRDRILKEIAAGKIPEHWNGIQLRLLIAERAQGNIMCATPQRRREFNNDCAVHNL